MKKRSVWLRRFKCNECGTIITAPKRADKLNKQEHIKTIWCYYCSKLTEFSMINYGDIYKV